MDVTVCYPLAHHVSCMPLFATHSVCHATDPHTTMVQILALVPSREGHGAGSMVAQARDGSRERDLRDAHEEEHDVDEAARKVQEGEGKFESNPNEARVKVAAQATQIVNQGRDAR